MKKRKAILTVIALALVLLAVAGSYAFFTANSSNDKKQEANLKTGTMALTFKDGNNGVSGQLMLNESITKKFIIENTGSLEASLSLDWVELLNTYLDRSLTYVLNRTDESGNKIETLVDKTNVPTSNERITQTMVGELSVPSEEMYYYDLIITLNNLDTDQESDKTAVFNTRFSVNKPDKYRYYTLTIDPNGGTWDTFTAPQDYQLMHDQTKTGIVNPTRVGYEFGGWEIKGTSSTFDSGTFTMGISDTYLIAKWTPKKVTITLNINGTPTTIEGDYGGTVTLEEPTKDGYNFDGWNVTGGTVDGNILTITDPDRVTVEAIWSPKNYQYIVYHNKMTTTGTYMPVGVDTDKEEGEKPFDTEYTAPVKDFGLGFTSPTPEPLRITSNVENNKKTYEYPRNKFQLTVNPNGGTGGTASQEVFYEATITLSAPTKVGYDFTKWTKTSGSGTLADNTVTMGTDETVVQANWTAKTIPVELNANGGQFENASTTTKSTTVTYASTYGEGTLGSLPKPTRSGYNFDGWYTTNASTGGTEIEDGTQVTTIEESQTLYARWKVVFDVPKVVTAMLNHTTVSGYKTGSPDFANVATTDEGVYAMEDDYGTSYYFRGAVTNNYVKFGGFYWRIIRINGNGSLRMIYDGQQTYDNGTNNPFRYAVRVVKWSVKDYDLADDAKYVGYMYGPVNMPPTDTYASKSAKAAQTNTADSNAKTQVETWYKNNIVTNVANGNKDLTPYLADAIFCNDRSLPPSGTTWVSWQDSKHSNLGWGTHKTPYGAYSRVTDCQTGSAKTPIATFTCSTNTTVSAVNDKFTVSTSSGGNGKLAYPVGLITMDEIAAAGSGKSGTANRLYYLYKSSIYEGWSLSPYSFDDNGNAYVFVVRTDGSLGSVYARNTDGAIAPVINLKSEYAAQLQGLGTMTSPYTVPNVN